MSRGYKGLCKEVCNVRSPKFDAEPFAEPQTPKPNLRFRFGAVQICHWGRYVWFEVRVEVAVGAPGVNRFEPEPSAFISIVASA